MTLIRITVALIAFCLGIGVGLWTFDHIAAQSPTSTSGVIEHLKTYGRDYDVIVVGSSVVRINFVPPVFDKRMKAHGFNIRSYNFALSGLMGSEMDYYIEQILKLDMPRLKWLFLDVTIDQQPRLKEGNYYKLRIIRWHNWTQYLQVQQAIMKGNGPLIDRLKRVGVHAQHLLLNLANVGEGMFMLNNNSWFGDPQKIKKRYHFHVGPGIRRHQSKKVKKYLATRLKKHKKAVERLSRIREQDRLRFRDLQLARRWRDIVSSYGVTPIFVVGPVLSDASIRSDVPGSDPLFVFDFNDPLTYPSLYRVETRCDPVHMTYDGAVQYTEMLADAFVERFREELR
jgi:hypothetical protein